MANQGNADSYTYYRENKPSKSRLYLQILKYIFKGVYFLSLSILFFIFRNSQWHLRLALVFYCIARIKYNLRLIKSIEWRELVLKFNWIDE